MNILQPAHSAQSRRRNIIISSGIVIMILVIGFVLYRSFAANSTPSMEAEEGTATGSATVISDPNASGGKAIQFGSGQAASPAPVNLRAFTGGDSIALLWNPMPGTSPASYVVYRDGVKLGTAALATDNSGGATTARYIDKAVTKGKTYAYQVQAVTGATASALSPSLNATHPSTPVAVPTITIDTAAVPADMKAWVQTAVPLLQTWYPKLVDYYATPGYTPTMSIKITVKKDTGVFAYASGDTITIDEAAGRNSMKNADGMLFILHESTHILQQYDGNAPKMIIEGLADYTVEYVYANRAPRPPFANEMYNSGYSPSSYFINWVATTFNKPALPHDLNVAAANKTYTDNFLKQQTGKTLGQLWKQMTGRTASSIGQLKNGSNKCADVLNYSTTNGNTIQITDCVNNSAQQWIYSYATATSTDFSLNALGKCMDVSGSGTADGAKVQIWDCNGSAAQRWKAGSNGSLINVNSGTCLQAKAGSAVNNTVLEISACNGSAAQKWTLPPV